MASQLLVGALLLASTTTAASAFAADGSDLPRAAVQRLSPEERAPLLLSHRLARARAYKAPRAGQTGAGAGVGGEEDIVLQNFLDTQARRRPP